MDNTARKDITFLFKHSSVYGIGELLNRAVGFFMLPLYTRYLMPSDYGVLEMVNITTGIVAIVLGLGVSQAMSRFYFEYSSQQERNEVVSTIVWLISFASLAAAVLLTPFYSKIAVLILADPNMASYVGIAISSVFFGMLSDCVLSYLRIKQKSKLVVTISIIRLIIMLGLNIYFIVFAHLGVLGILLSVFITRILFSTLMLLYLVCEVGFAYVQSKAREILSFSMPLIPSNLAHTLVNCSDRLFIRHFMSLADVGLYGIAQRFGTILHSFVTSPFIQTFNPKRFEIVKEENAGFRFAKIFDFYFMLISFLSFFVIVMSSEILHVMTTENYFGAAKMIPLVVLSIICLGFKYHFELGILYAKKTKTYSMINVCTSICNVGMNYFFIKKFGVWGALMTLVFIRFLNSALILLFSNKEYPIPFRLHKVLVVLIVGGCLYWVSNFLKINIIIASLLYKFGVGLLFGISMVFVMGYASSIKECFVKYGKAS